MRKSIKISFFLFSAILLSCSEEKSLEKTFVGEVWVVDSIKTRFLDVIIKQEERKGGYVGSWNNILKPIENGEFDIYKDQTPIFSNFRISHDTLYLKNSKSNKFEPFFFEKINNYTYKAEAINEDFEEYAYYFTNLTDLFQEKVNNESALYNSISDKVWYPTEEWLMGKKVYDEFKPEYYIKERAFGIKGDSLIYSYEFEKNSIVKFTENGLYSLNPKDKSLMVFKVNFKDNILEMEEINNRYLKFNLKRIGKELLIDRKDLPKKVRLNCNKIIAEEVFEDWILEDVDSSFYYDIETIKLVDYNEENCEYVFSIIYKSRSFSDIYSTHKYKLTYMEDGRIKIESN